MPYLHIHAITTRIAADIYARLWCGITRGKSRKIKYCKISPIRVHNFVIKGAHCPAIIIQKIIKKNITLPLKYLLSIRHPTTYMKIATLSILCRKGALFDSSQHTVWLNSAIEFLSFYKEIAWMATCRKILRCGVLH